MLRTIFPWCFSRCRGQKAWARIKATAEEQRTLWLEVGVALMYGKQKENRRAGQKFSEWVQECFPGLDTTSEVADAIWYASEFRNGSEKLPPGLSHPSRIRQWKRDAAQSSALPAELLQVSPEPSLTLPARDAERVAKTILRAQSGDEGSETAKRHVEALAIAVKAKVNSLWTT